MDLWPRSGRDYRCDRVKAKIAVLRTSTAIRTCGHGSLSVRNDTSHQWTPPSVASSGFRSDIQGVAFRKARSPDATAWLTDLNRFHCSSSLSDRNSTSLNSTSGRIHTSAGLIPSFSHMTNTGASDHRHVCAQRPCCMCVLRKQNAWTAMFFTKLYCPASSDGTYRRTVPKRHNRNQQLTTL